MTTVAVSSTIAIAERSVRRGVRVLLVDDEEIVLWGFRLLFADQPWVERCLTAHDSAIALELAQRFEPQVALLDTGVLDREPSGFCRELARTCQRVSILLLTHTTAIAPSTVRASGAVGFVSRSWPAGELLRAIRRASAGLSVAASPPPVQSNLSARQEEVLQLIADGATNREIAERLYLSCETVKQHTSALYRKLGARNRTHAVQTARRQGLIAV